MKLSMKVVLLLVYPLCNGVPNKTTLEIPADEAFLRQEPIF